MSYVVSEVVLELAKAHQARVREEVYANRLYGTVRMPGNSLRHRLRQTVGSALVTLGYRLQQATPDLEEQWHLDVSVKEFFDPDGLPVEAARERARSQYVK